MGSHRNTSIQWLGRVGAFAAGSAFLAVGVLAMILLGRQDANADVPILVPLETFAKRARIVSIEKSGYKPYSRRLEFEPGETHVLSVELQRL